MGVDLIGGRGVRVAKDHLSVLRRDAELLQQRRRGVTQRVNLDAADAAGITDPVERAIQVARLNRQAGLGAEDQARVGPGRAEPLAIAGLRVAADRQRIVGQAEQRQVPKT